MALVLGSTRGPEHLQGRRLRESDRVGTFLHGAGECELVGFALGSGSLSRAGNIVIPIV